MRNKQDENQCPGNGPSETEAGYFRNLMWPEVFQQFCKGWEIPKLKQEACLRGIGNNGGY